MTTPSTLPPILAATTAAIGWAHPVAGRARCLVRIRTAPGTPRIDDTDALAAVVVVSELRDNPRGARILSDMAGIAVAVLAALIPRSCPPQAITWYAHHGDFSTYDGEGYPETLTQVDLRWDGHRYVDDVHDHHLLDARASAQLRTAMQLEPVPAVLASWPWAALPPPAPPRPAGT